MIDTSDGTDGNAPLEIALPNPFGSLSPQRQTVSAGLSSSQIPSLVPVRTEEEQQAAARERERLENAVSARKDARRKSLGALSKFYCHTLELSATVYAMMLIRF